MRQMAPRHARRTLPSGRKTPSHGYWPPFSRLSMHRRIVHRTRIAPKSPRPSPRRRRRHRLRPHLPISLARRMWHRPRTHHGHVVWRDCRLFAQPANELRRRHDHAQTPRLLEVHSQPPSMHRNGYARPHGHLPHRFRRPLRNSMAFGRLLPPLASSKSHSQPSPQAS